MSRSIDAAIDLLRVAKLVAAEVPVPGLSTALETALSIAESAKNVKDTRDGCKALAERAASLSLGIYDALKKRPWGTEAAPISTQEHVVTLLCALQDIENLMWRRQKRRWLSLVLKQDAIADEVKRLTTKLDDAVKLFTVQAALEVGEGMNILTNRVLQHAENSERLGDALLKSSKDVNTNVTDLLHRVTLTATHDGPLRYYTYEDLALSEVIPEEGSTYLLMDIPCGTAILFGQSVVAKETLPIPHAVLKPTSPPVTVTLNVAKSNEYYTETTLHGTSKPGCPPPSYLYFFLLEQDRAAQRYDLHYSPPGFWSTEKDPTSFPTMLHHSYTEHTIGHICGEPLIALTWEPRRFERVSDDNERALLFNWTQVLDEMFFSISVKIATSCNVYDADELLFLREHLYNVKNLAAPGIPILSRSWSEQDEDEMEPMEENKEMEMNRGDED
ncbi:hypothetical protein BV20DRAFT_1050981 [Pilatotrama ljubarskyi]|nr:hypothetical protein BV20DRAFT_1050981 [Pilatotrama ljubarskyi]